ncbi:hypothetical protein QBC34DRAFT_386922 [Podospora aff. communis PSN243]|uniref:Fungal N-terminal domain-containing protein n=1 Tax=Podospora aff. communis PSN243 TaxID=3040156 RepID=A0AAV9G0P1_9PEZI|nr:hypothetical protein QBC34DRAFT_386922 [Podospora aff. communis PSN243]
MPKTYMENVEAVLLDCNSVVDQIGEAVKKNQANGVFTKTSWVMFGKSDVQKLRESLEAYKMALSLGMHAMTISTTHEIKNDTTTIRDQTDAIKVNTDAILARLDHIRSSNVPSKRKRIEEWMDDVTTLSKYAESIYEGTTLADSVIDSPAMSDVPFQTSDTTVVGPGTSNSNRPWDHNSDSDCPWFHTMKPLPPGSYF